uniref:Uncharacterized protein n=1 Tax=Spongospora subterranea TaxID=70186 RepID=A0A0H5QQ08_9EUKA|eukprot:CRZ04175.1 hypothetical protein [Spongospora subterranea]
MKLLISSFFVLIVCAAALGDNEQSTDNDRVVKKKVIITTTVGLNGSVPNAVPVNSYQVSKPNVQNTQVSSGMTTNTKNTQVSTGVTQNNVSSRTNIDNTLSMNQGITSPSLTPQSQILTSPTSFSANVQTSPLVTPADASKTVLPQSPMVSPRPTTVISSPVTALAPPLVRFGPSEPTSSFVKVPVAPMSSTGGAVFRPAPQPVDVSQLGRISAVVNNPEPVPTNHAVIVSGPIPTRSDSGPPQVLLPISGLMTSPAPVNDSQVPVENAIRRSVLPSGIPQTQWDVRSPVTPVAFVDDNSIPLLSSEPKSSSDGPQLLVMGPLKENMPGPLMAMNRPSPPKDITPDSRDTNMFTSRPSLASNVVVVGAPKLSSVPSRPDTINLSPSNQDFRIIRGPTSRMWIVPRPGSSLSRVDGPLKTSITIDAASVANTINNNGANHDVRSPTVNMQQQPLSSTITGFASEQPILPSTINGLEVNAPQTPNVLQVAQMPNVAQPTNVFQPPVNPSSSTFDVSLTSNRRTDINDNRQITLRISIPSTQ